MSFRKYIFILFLFQFQFFHFYVYGNKNDSLICNMLLRKGADFAFQANDSAIDIYKNLASYAKHCKLYFYVAEAYNRIGTIFSNKGEYKKADLYLNAAVKIFKLLRDNKSLSFCLINKANLELFQEHYEHAISFYNKALIIAEKYNDTLIITKAYSNISRCYYYMNDFDKAKAVTEKAIHKCLYYNDSITLANLYNNYGAILDKLNDKQAALRAYYNAKRIYKRKNQLTKLVSTYNNLGNVFKDLKQYDSALYYMQTALDIKRKGKNIKSLCISLGNLSELWTEMNNIDKAETYANEMLKLADSIHDKTQQMYAHSYLANIYKNKKNYFLAYKHLEQYQVLYDSLNNIDFKERIDKMVAQLELKSKDIQIQKLLKDQKIKDAVLKAQKTELKNKTLWTYFYLFIIFILLLIFMLAHYIIKNKNTKKHSILENQMMAYRMQALSHQINPHFIFNVLNSIQYNVNKKEVELTNTYITQLSKLLRAVLDNSQSQLISLLAELESLKLYLELEQMRLKNKFNYNIIKKSDFDLMQYKLPPLILQPFVENSIWHGIMNVEDENYKGQIEIILSEKNNYLQCEIIDNGLGFNHNKEINNHTSHGLEVTKKRIETFNKLYKSNINFTISNLEHHPQFSTGTIVVINIPKVII